MWTPSGSRFVCISSGSWRLSAVSMQPLIALEYRPATRSAGVRAGCPAWRILAGATAWGSLHRFFPVSGTVVLDSCGPSDTPIPYAPAHRCPPDASRGVRLLDGVEHPFNGPQHLRDPTRRGQPGVTTRLWEHATDHFRGIV